MIDEPEPVFDCPQCNEECSMLEHCCLIADGVGMVPQIYSLCPECYNKTVEELNTILSRTRKNE